mmetsp:Transcript_1576/g.4711  ORF Transcript_1576/g.4711 Transcript_1576/m.4711 type:complete len:203 (+) Transcript_1576:152-760(+)
MGATTRIARASRMVAHAPHIATRASSCPATSPAPQELGKSRAHARRLARSSRPKASSRCDCGSRPTTSTRAPRSPRAPSVRSGRRRTLTYSRTPSRRPCRCRARTSGWRSSRLARTARMSQELSTSGSSPSCHRRSPPKTPWPTSRTVCSARAAAGAWRTSSVPRWTPQVRTVVLRRCLSRRARRPRPASSPHSPWLFRIGS